jgi:hypothetical protein
MSNHSGITHHMVFKKEYINSLFKLIESFHNKDFWKVFLYEVDIEDRIIEKGGTCSGASEYEIFFNFMQIYFQNQYTIRPLKYKNVSNFHINNSYDYISCHYYM